jgi:hypothetical protein
MTLQITPLTRSNLAAYFLFKPQSKYLNSRDKALATLATIALGFTFGIGHLICRLSSMTKIKI